MYQFQILHARTKTGWWCKIAHIWDWDGWWLPQKIVHLSPGPWFSVLASDGHNVDTVGTGTMIWGKMCQILGLDQNWVWLWTVTNTRHTTLALIWYFHTSTKVIPFSFNFNFYFKKNELEVSSMLKKLIEVVQNIKFDLHFTQNQLMIGTVWHHRWEHGPDQPWVLVPGQSAHHQDQ